MKPATRPALTLATAIVIGGCGQSSVPAPSAARSAAECGAVLSEPASVSSEGVVVTSADAALPGYTWTNFRLPPGAEPDGLAFGPDCNLWMTQFTGAVARIAADGTGYTRFTAGVTGNPWGMTLGSDGNLWYSATGHVGRVTPDGNVTEFAVPGGWGIGGPDGNVYFTSDSGVGRFRPEDPLDTLELWPLPQPGMALTVDRGGNVWVTYNVHSLTNASYIWPLATAGVEAAESENGVARITPAGTVTIYPFPPGHQVSGIAVARDGTIWTSDHVSKVPGDPALQDFSTHPPICRFLPEEPVGTLRCFHEGIAPGNHHFVAMEAAADGNVYLADDAGDFPSNMYRVYRLAPDDTITEIPGPLVVPAAAAAGTQGAFETSGIQFVTIGPDGNLWFQVQFDDDIVRLTIPR